jgi:hypothetical protein
MRRGVAGALVALGVLAGVTLVACGGSGSPALVDFPLEAFRDPPVGVRPWVRWWWPGNDVEPAELRREVGVLADGFFGGAEIQAMDAALDPGADPEELARRRSVDTGAYFGNVAAALDEARARGLAVDLTLGSGWPPGGAFVSQAGALQMLAFSEQRVQGPATVKLALDGPDKPAFYSLAGVIGGADQPIEFLPGEATLVAVVAAQVAGGERTTALLDFSDQLVLYRESVQVLTGLAQGGSIAWEAPAGVWVVVALYRLPDGVSPIFNAEPAPARTVDHFDRAQVLAALDTLAGAATGLDAYYGTPLRGLFVDSLELKTERFFATDLLNEFKARRGYDLVPWLPVVLLPGADNHLFDGLGLPVLSPFGFDPADDARVQHDYQRTVAELFQERFLDTAADWAAQRGLLTRVQAYGANLDVLRALGSAAIPEVEQLYAGGPDLFLKLASSAAHLYGRGRASAESLVWTRRDQEVTPTRWKAGLDKLFAAGINHVVYHGFPYVLREGYGEAGWSPFSSPHGGASTYSMHLAEDDPFWPDVPALNAYAARCQYALSAGRPAVDLLVYYPWYGFPASFFRQQGEGWWEPLFNGRLEEDDGFAGTEAQFELMDKVFGEPQPGEREAWLLRMGPVLAELHARGWTWDWVNDDSLAVATVEGGRLAVRGQAFGGLLLYDVPALEPDLAERLADLAGEGAVVVGHGASPVRQPGYLEAAAGDARVRAAMTRLAGGDHVRWSAAGGPGLAESLAEAGAAPGLSVESSSPWLRNLARDLGRGARVVFLANPRREPLEASLSVDGGCDRPAWLDPWSGKVRAAAAGADGELPLELEAFGSRLLACGLDLPGPDPDPAPLDESQSFEIPGWTLEVTADDVPAGYARLDLPALADWRDLPDLRFSGGPGVYTARVDLPSLPVGGRLELDLGRVEGVVDVTWNEQEAGHLRVPPFKADVTALASAGVNTVRVKVTVPRKNRLVGKAQAGDQGCRQFKDKADELARAGLLGPVTVRGVAGQALPAQAEPLPVFRALTTPPEASTLPPGLDSCAQYGATVCEDGALRRCEVWDSAAQAFAAQPDPWLEQILVFDRYYDQYHRMEGQQAEFLYTRPMPPGTPESEWGAPDSFQRYEGFWDSAGWTGTALQAAAARYRVTGTPADYQRLLEQFEAMMLQYQATGVPGLLMRCHYAMLPEGAPPPVGHPGQALVAHTPSTNWEDHFPLGEPWLSRLPAYYREGVTIDGAHYDVEPKWMGHASRDMYVRSLPGILLAYDLLGQGEREEALRDAVRRVVPCTLKRLKKLRIRNLQQNPEVREALTAYLAAGTMRSEPGDLDLATLDTIYGYVMEEPRPDRLEAFDPTCPDAPPMDPDPAYDLDAAQEDAFVAGFVSIMARTNGAGDVPVAWILSPSVRGADALFMAQWALAGQYLTGDERFMEFFDRLVDESDFWRVVNLMGSFWLPKWCKSHYGPSLLYPTLWNLQKRVDRARHPAFWTRLARAIHEEVRDKELVEADDAYFAVLYAGMLDSVVDPDLPAYVARLAGMLRGAEQYPAGRLEPHRSYSHDWVADPPPGADFQVQAMSDADRAICSAPLTLFGVTFPSEFQDDRPRAAQALPLALRIDGPLQWQEDPFMLIKDYGDRDARTQWPGTGFSVAYWTARMQGTVNDGQGQALAWRGTGDACP